MVGLRSYTTRAAVGSVFSTTHLNHSADSDGARHPHVIIYYMRLERRVSASFPYGYVVAFSGIHGIRNWYGRKPLRDSARRRGGRGVSSPFLWHSVSTVNV